ncbi:MAG: hypothetical protein U1F77_12010 [Kiritimatiellia bacterium]
MSATACLAACDAILGASKGGVRPEIKWVNDVRLGPAKVAGILTTARAVDGRLRSVVFDRVERPVPAGGIEPTPFVPVIGTLADRLPAASIVEAWAALVAGLLTASICSSAIPTGSRGITRPLRNCRAGGPLVFRGRHQPSGDAEVGAARSRRAGCPGWTESLDRLRRR